MGIRHHKPDRNSKSHKRVSFLATMALVGASSCIDLHDNSLVLCWNMLIKLQQRYPSHFYVSRKFTSPVSTMLATSTSSWHLVGLWLENWYKDSSISSTLDTNSYKAKSLSDYISLVAHAMGIHDKFGIFLLWLCSYTWSKHRHTICKHINLDAISSSAISHAPLENSQWRRESC